VSDQAHRGERLLTLAERVLALAPPSCEVLVEVRADVHALTRFANSRIHQNVADDRTTVTVLVADDGRSAVSSTNGSGHEELAALVDRALTAARQRPADPDWPGVAPAAPVTPAGHWDDATAAATPDERARVVADFVAAARPGQEAAGYCDTESVVTAVATSAGQRATDRFARATLDGMLLGAPEGGHTPAGYGHQTSGRLADLDGGAVGRPAAADCERSVTASDLAPGDYEVVLLPDCVATVVSFLAAYGFDAKAVEEGQSFVSLGDAPFDPRFSLTDDVYDPRSLGLGIDAEGTARQRVALVDEGVCRGLVHDRRTAAKAGATSTGHAWAAGSAAGADAASLVVAQGSATVDELVGRMGRGLVVTCFNYCRVLDPKTVGVTGLTRNGTFLVEDGQVTGAVTNLRFTQSFVTALGAGKVLGVSSGARLADSEWSPGRILAPALHLASWRFTGGAAG
jgi:predicted Zn-dependent protease